METGEKLPFPDAEQEHEKRKENIMKKRVVSLLLCLIMALSLIPTVAFAAEPVAERQQSVEQLDTLAGDPQATSLITRTLGWKYAKIEQPSTGGLTITQPSTGEDLSDKVTVTIEQPLGGTKNMDQGTPYETFFHPLYKKVRITADPNYYIAYVAFCCIGPENNSYNCTAPQLLRKGDKSTASVSMTMWELSLKQSLDHASYCWLMVMVKPIEETPTPDPITGTLTIEKTVQGLKDEDTPEAFNFTITGDNNYSNRVSVSIRDGLKATIANLPFGTYTITESNAAIEGYNLTTTYDNQEVNSYNVTLKADNPTVTVTVTNNYTKNTGDDVNNFASITINKYETGDNAKKPIGGAKFYLEKLDKNSTVISGTYYDTVAGKALTIGNLTEGNYRLTEAEAPFGYQKVNTVWTFTVTKTTTTDINSENQQVTTNTYKITKVDNSTCDEATHVFDVANTKLPNVTAKVTITKNVNVTGNTQPTATTMPTFQFVAKVDNTEVGKLSLTPKKDANGKWTASGDMTVSIPANLFVKDNVTVTISEVDGKLNYWTYDKNVKSLQIAKNGTIHNPVIVKSAAEVAPTDPTIASFTFTNEYKYTYTPPARPSDPIRRQPTTTTTKPVQSVKTGDMGIALYAVTSLLSLSGTALLIKKRKDEK